MAGLASAAADSTGAHVAKVGFELILRARAGEDLALEELIAHYQQPIGRFVASQLGSFDDGLDVCQIIFVKMVRGLPSLKSPELFEAWLFRIARNVCADQARRYRRQKQTFVPLARAHVEAAAHPEPAPTASMDVMHVAVRELAAPQRQLLELSLEKPRTYEELAALTRSTVPSVRNRLFRARERLKQLVGLGRDKP